MRYDYTYDYTPRIPMRQKGSKFIMQLYYDSSVSRYQPHLSAALQ
jgi:hypothetical protein